MNHFTQAAATWDNQEREKIAHIYSEKIKAHLKMKSNLKIIDFGCGTGLLAANFIEEKKEIIGVDTSKEMLEIFQQKFAANSDVRSLLLTGEDDEINETGVDLVISSMAFHHLKNPLRMLQNLKRLLSEGGMVAIVDLDEEDGSFHADPKKMGVEHFGFGKDTLASWARDAGFSKFTYEIANTIKKESGSFPIFLATFSN